jgi:hypothetical protein
MSIIPECLKHEHIEKTVSLIPEMHEKINTMHDALMGTPLKPDAGFLNRIIAIEKRFTAASWIVGSLFRAAALGFFTWVFTQ